MEEIEKLAGKLNKTEEEACDFWDISVEEYREAKKIAEKANASE